MTSTLSIGFQKSKMLPEIELLVVATSRVSIRGRSVFQGLKKVQRASCAPQFSQEGTKQFLQGPELMAAQHCCQRKISEYAHDNENGDPES